jgi:hypothetical protein
MDSVFEILHWSNERLIAEYEAQRKKVDEICKTIAESKSDNLKDLYENQLKANEYLDMLYGVLSDRRYSGRL